jgi:hypothetical protein
MNIWKDYARRRLDQSCFLIQRSPVEVREDLPFAESRLKPAMMAPVLAQVSGYVVLRCSVASAFGSNDRHVCGSPLLHFLAADKLGPYETSKPIHCEHGVHDIHGVASFMLETVFIDCLARIELRLRDRVGEEEKKFIDRGNGGNQRLRKRG